MVTGEWHARIVAALQEAPQNISYDTLANLVLAALAVSFPIQQDAEK